jgi:hypothetical protein
MADAPCSALNQLDALTADLLAAARSQDFARANDLAAEYEALSARVQREPLLERDAALATAILDRQREIERLVGPWLDEVRRLMRDTRNEQRVAAAYGQGG